MSRGPGMPLFIPKFEQTVIVRDAEAEVVGRAHTR